MHFWVLIKVLGLNVKELNNNIFKNYKHNESRKQQMKTALLNLLPQLLSLRNNYIIFCEEKNPTQTIKHQPLRQTFLTLTMGIFSPSVLYTVPKIIIQRISHLSLSRVRLCVTSRTAARQRSLSITNFCSLFKLMSIKLVMPAHYLILRRPLLQHTVQN